MQRLGDGLEVFAGVMKIQGFERRLEPVFGQQPDYTTSSSFTPSFRHPFPTVVQHLHRQLVKARVETLHALVCTSRQWNQGQARRANRGQRDRPSGTLQADRVHFR